MTSLDIMVGSPHLSYSLSCPGCIAVKYGEPAITDTHGRYHHGYDKSLLESGFVSPGDMELEFGLQLELPWDRIAVPLYAVMKNCSGGASGFWR